MAEKIDDFKKRYTTLTAAIDTCHEEIKKNERAVGQTAGIVQEGTKVVGNRVQELKDKGQSGTTIADFAKDPEVKTMMASLEQHLVAIDKQLKSIVAVHAQAKSKSVVGFWALKTEVEGEIKSRKKAVSTKLGTGNKSLVDMEKLLVDINKYKDSGTFVGVDIFVPETIEQHRKEFNFAIKDEIAKAKDVRLTAEQQMLDEQALNERNLTKNTSAAKSLVEAIGGAVKKAGDALASKNAKALKEEQELVVKAAKQLAGLASIYDRALKDQWIRSKIKDSSIKGKIEATAKFIGEADSKVAVLAKKVAEMKV
jgi:hypothetical protein